MTEAKPRFRPDIVRHSHAEAHGGQSIVLQDPLANKFFRISPYEYELLSIFDGTLSLREAIERLRLRGRYFTLKHAAKLVDKFAKAGLLLGTSYGTSKVQTGLKDRLQTELRQRSILKLYYMYIPLLSPDRFLERTLRLWTILTSRLMLAIFLFLVPGAVYLLVLGIQRFEAEYLFFFNLRNLVVLWIAIAFVKIVHEFSHAYTAKSLGLRVPEMGVAFLIFFPCLYCNTTDAWQLSDRRERMSIALAGVLSEVVIAVFATYIWYFTKPGLINSIAFYLVAISVISSVLFNGNPLLKFDGYFVLSDWLRIPNLQAKAFNYLRHLFFNRVLGIEGFEASVSSIKQNSIMLGYGVSALLYRIVLYSGIIERIYSTFDKTLGLAMGAMAFALFIVRPLGKAAANLLKRRSEMCFRPRGLLVFFLLLFAFILMVSCPWSDHSVYPCFLESAMVRQIVVPVDAPVSEVTVRKGDVVRSGDILFKLNPVPLAQNLKDKQAERLFIKTEIAMISGVQKDDHKLEVKYIELSQTEDSIKKIQEDLANLDWIAPFDGVVSDLSSVFEPGAAPGKGSVVGEFASRTACEVLALIPESDVTSVSVGGTVVVWWPIGTGTSYPVSVREVSLFKTEDLEGSAFSSRFGGEIATEAKDKAGKDAPLEPYYLCKMDFPNQAGIRLGMTGRLTVKHPPKSTLRRLIDAAYGVFHREIIF